VITWKLHDKSKRFRFRSCESLLENYMTKVKGLGLGVMSDYLKITWPKVKGLGLGVMSDYLKITWKQ